MRNRTKVFSLILMAATSAPLAAQQRQAHAFVPERAMRFQVAEFDARTRRRHTLQNAAWFAGYGVIAFGVIWVLPEDISKWPKDQRELTHLLDAYRRPPVWDEDPLFWNYAVHPVLGAYSYLAERNYGESRLRGFLFSTATSVGWEYGVEAWVEHPSAQDLLITSTTGSVLGELSYLATRKLGRNGFRAWEKAIVLVINPLWAAQRGFRTVP